MSPFFTRRTPAERGTTSTLSPPAGPAATPADVRCDSYAPGHQMHYIHQGQALRSPSTPARNVIVDGTRVIVGTVNHYVYLTEVRDEGGEADRDDERTGECESERAVAGGPG